MTWESGAGVRDVKFLAGQIGVVLSEDGVQTAWGWGVVELSRERAEEDARKAVADVLEAQRQSSEKPTNPSWRHRRTIQ